ncbi:MAG: DMT family transporter [Synechococcales cyanobacterium RU_4_20]|nr:DMT family transporter [Synechococcales cyanobacterium RU_4_20]NJR68242.1 DMT family transporter [Synechococcales cyanobacterium CRU_2_2]
MRLPSVPDRLPFEPLLLVAPFFFWGTAMVAMKSTLTQTTPLFLATVRLVPAGAMILLMGWGLGRSHPQGWRVWLWILAFACLDGALFQGFLAEGLQRTDAGLGSVMIDSQPLAVALMARWLFGEYIGRWGFLGLLLGIMGISLLGLPDEWILQVWRGLLSQVSDLFNGGLSRQWLSALADLSKPGLPQDLPIQLQMVLAALFQNGQWLMLLASLSMASGTILSRFVFREADPIMATGWHMLLGGLPLMALSALTEQHQWDALTLSDGLAMAYSTVFGSAIAYGLFFYFAAQRNLTSLSALTFLTPVFALLFGNLFLAEQLSPIQDAGVILTLISIYLINQRERLTAFFGAKSAKADPRTSSSTPTQ